LSEEKKDKREANFEIGPKLLELLAKLQRVELEDFEMEVENLELWLPSAAAMMIPPKAAVTPTPMPKVKPTRILEEEFIPPIEEYTGMVREVTLGATKSEGGSRGKTVTIGGATTPAFYIFEKPPKHPPVVALDTFDMKVPLPNLLKMPHQRKPRRPLRKFYKRWMFR